MRLLKPLRSPDSCSFVLWQYLPVSILTSRHLTPGSLYKLPINYIFKYDQMSGDCFRIIWGWEVGRTETIGHNSVIIELGWKLHGMCSTVFFSFEYIYIFLKNTWKLLSVLILILVTVHMWAFRKKKPQRMITVIYPIDFISSFCHRLKAFRNGKISHFMSKPGSVKTPALPFTKFMLYTSDFGFHLIFLLWKTGVNKIPYR